MIRKKQFSLVDCDDFRNPIYRNNIFSLQNRGKEGFKMKKILFIAALTMVSATASASIARRNALDAVNGSAFPLVTANGTAITQSGVNLVTAITAADDVQDSFVNPGKMHSFGDLFTAEYQTGGTTAEGGVFRSMGDSKFGVYLNHKSALMSAMTSVTPGTPIAEQNPFEVFYGMKGGSLKWGASLLYSETKNNQTTTATAGTKTTDAGARFGIVADMWEAYVGLGLLGRAEKYNGDKSVADLAYRLGGQFNLPTVTLYADMQSGSGKSTVGTTDTKLSAQLITLGAESKVKSETAHFFYGARYITFNQKLGDN